MTPATFGLSSPRQFAEYDPDTSSWRTWPDTGLWGSTLFSGTWPRSGMTRGGRAFSLRMSGHPTDVNGSSSLLKTPTAQLAINGGSQHPDKRKEGGHGPTLADEVEHLLPTPTAQTFGTQHGNDPTRETVYSLEAMAAKGMLAHRKEED